ASLLIKAPVSIQGTQSHHQGTDSRRCRCAAMGELAVEHSRAKNGFDGLPLGRNRELALGCATHAYQGHGIRRVIEAESGDSVGAAHEWAFSEGPRGTGPRNNAAGGLRKPISGHK